MTESEDWVVVHECGTDYEGELVRDRLDDSGIPAVIRSKRDHAFFLNVGTLSNVFVLVPREYEDDAKELLIDSPVSPADLADAAMRAEPHSDVHPDVDGDDDEDE